jgi:hypothetical protein
MKRKLGRPKHRWKDNIKMYLQELGWNTCIGLIWLRIGSRGEFVSRQTVMKVRVRNYHYTLRNIPEELGKSL